MSHNFINKHTAWGILIVIVGCFMAGYYVGKNHAYVRGMNVNYQVTK